MGDKAIITDILEQSHLTDTYRTLRPKEVIEGLVKRKKEEGPSTVRYEGLREDRPDGNEAAGGSGADSGAARVHFGATGDRKDDSDQEVVTFGNFKSHYDNDKDDSDMDGSLISDDSGLQPLIFRDASGTFTVDQAVDALGFGKFQMKLSIITGLAWMADAMEMMILSILSPALHCDWWLESWQLALITTVVFCGMMLSSTLWGNINDKYGRKTGLIMCTIVTFYYGILSSLAPNYLWLLILRAMVGFGIGGVPQSVTLYAEFLPSAHRAKCVVLIEAFWGIGACFEVLLALFVMPSLGWRWLLAMSSLPMLLFTLSCYWLPESARYHVASGQKELAYATLKRVAEENGKPMLAGKLVDNNAQDQRRGRIVDLFVPELRRTTLLLWFVWFANAFSYYGLVLFTTELFQSNDHCHGAVEGEIHSEPACPLECRRLSTKDYTDLLWTTLAEFPGMLITAAVIEYLGRKKTMALEFLIFSLFTFLLFACLNRTQVTVFLFIARAFISGAFQGAYVYTPEVYPTTLRAIGLGSCSGMARVGAIITPFVAQVAAQTSLAIPVGIYGSMCILGAVAAMLLPIETRGREMKDTH